MSALVDVPLRTRPSTGPAASPGTRSPGTRRHDLDALRGAVMLLGIALHSALPFFSTIWPVPDPSASTDNYFDEFVQAIHGFRMQLFFVLSGFFTAMLLHRRGLRALLAHRSKRVLVPLLVGAVTIVPLIELLAAGAALPEGGFSAAGTGAPTNTEWLTPRQNLHHLWFLWFLCIYVAGVALLQAATARRRPRSRAFRTGVLALLVLLPLAPQYLMVGTGPERTFGPALPNHLSPDRAALTYYAAFFAFGFLIWSARSRSGVPFIDTLGRGWPLVLAGSLLVVFPLARAATWDDPTGPQLPAAVLQTVFAWGMVVGLIGLARRVLTKERRSVQYLADASYWIYLMHLPLVIGFHRLIHTWDAPASVKFTVLCVSVTAVLLVTYQTLVRYTILGRYLHGARQRRGAVPA